MVVCVCNSSTEKVETEESSGLIDRPVLTTWQVLGHWESLSQQQQQKKMNNTILKKNSAEE